MCKKANITDLKKEMMDFSQNFIKEHNRNTPVNILWDLFKVACENLLNKIAPSKTTTKTKTFNPILTWDSGGKIQQLNQQ